MEEGDGCDNERDDPVHIQSFPKSCKDTAFGPADSLGRGGAFKNGAGTASSPRFVDRMPFFGDEPSPPAVPACRPRPCPLIFGPLCEGRPCSEQALGSVT